MGWTLVNICDLCDSVSATYSSGADMVTLVNTSDVLDGKFLNTNKVLNKNLKGQFKKTFQKGDILYSEIRPINKHFAYVDFDATDHIASTKLMVLRAKPNVNSLFLYHILKNKSTLVQLQALAEARSGTFPQITYSEMANVHCFLPDRATQDRIVAILSSLDDKIELNRRINANLEQQAQALYKSWFVDFEPFGGKMPEDWKEGTLGDIIETIESGSRPKGGSETSGVPSIGAEKIERFGHYEYSGEKFINRDYFHKMKRGHVKNGDVLLYKDGAYTGKTSMVLDGFPYRECAVNEHVFILRTVASKYQFFLYCLMSYPDIRKMVYTLASAKAAQPGLNQTELLGVHIVVPSYNMIKEFNHIITPHMHQIAINALESSRLAQLRDTLLPKLMSGEITV